MTVQTVMCTFQWKDTDQKPSVTEVNNKYNIVIDQEFGVILIDPEQKLYVFLVSEAEGVKIAQNFLNEVKVSSNPPLATCDEGPFIGIFAEPRPKAPRPL